MRKLALVLTLFFCAQVLGENPKFNPELAKELGADEYGMKVYIMVTLLTGDDSGLSEEQKNELFSGHISNMSRLAEEKKLVMAGPFLQNPTKRGLFIFNTDDLALAETWVKSDPAVEAGVFTYEMAKIYNSAALMLINEQHKSLAQKNPG